MSAISWVEQRANIENDKDKEHTKINILEGHLRTINEIMSLEDITTYTTNKISNTRFNIFSSLCVIPTNEIFKLYKSKKSRKMIKKLFTKSQIKLLKKIYRESKALDN